MMNRIIPLLTCLSLALASSATAGLVSQRSAANDSLAEFNKRMPPRETAIANATREAEMLGWDLYRTEALADIAGFDLTTVMTAAQRADIQGYIVLPGATSWAVRFYGQSDRGSYTPVGDIYFDASDRASARKDGLAAFNAQEIALIRATELVKAKEPPCDGTYKTITLLAADKSINVYLIREALDATHLPEGQHLRYTVSSDGTKILSSREFARRCNLISSDVDSGTKQEEVKITSSLDPQPTEIQVYLSLRYGVDIFLATTQSNLYWQINKGIATTD